jgi:hypothetical protein
MPNTCIVRRCIGDTNNTLLAIIRAYVGTLAAAAVGITMFGAGVARAQDTPTQELTIVTFTAPVEIPGKILSAGTYVFKVVEPVSSQDVVQVMDKDQSHLITTILAIPDYRIQPAGKPVVMFDERPANGPPAVRGWFFPGENYGHQFVYPHDRAAELAKKYNQKILSTRSGATKADEMRKSKVEGVDANGHPVDAGVPPSHPR